MVIQTYLNNEIWLELNVFFRRHNAHKDLGSQAPKCFIKVCTWVYFPFAVGNTPRNGDCPEVVDQQKNGVHQIIVPELNIVLTVTVLRMVTLVVMEMLTVLYMVTVLGTVSSQGF